MVASSIQTFNQGVCAAACASVSSGPATILSYWIDELPLFPGVESNINDWIDEEPLSPQEIEDRISQLVADMSGELEFIPNREEPDSEDWTFQHNFLILGRSRIVCLFLHYQY